MVLVRAKGQICVIFFYLEINSIGRLDCFRRGHILVSKTSDVADFYDEMAKDDDYDKFWAYDKALYDQIHPILVAHIGRIRNVASEILDVGCGTGAQTSILCKKGFKSVYGIDISKGLLRICSTRTRMLNHRPLLLNSDVSALPFRDRTFDHIVCFYNVLNHVPQYAFAIEEMYRVLKTEGYMLLEIEKVSMSDLFYGGLDILFGGRLEYEITLPEWLQQLRRPFSTVIARWSYQTKQVKYLRFSPKDVEKICRRAGFRILRKYGISILSGMIPWGLLKTESEFSRSFSSLLRNIDRRISDIPFLRNMGLNTVYVMKKGDVK